MIQVTTKQPTTYYQLKTAKKRLVINQGGARSGKTYSILQVIAEYCWLNKNCGAVVTVVRKTRPALRATAYRDFIDILQRQDWYNENLENKSEMSYLLFGNLVEFISVDQPQKVRGRKRNVCFINEANELEHEDYTQLNLRTYDKMILDYNPSDEFHWIYDKLINDKSDFFVTTYLDNPHNPPEIVQVIEDLKDTDPNHWRVYGLGQRGTSTGVIYTHWKYCDQLPGRGEVIYGQDFGFNNPMALVKLEIFEGSVYVDECVYQTKMTMQNLVDEYRLIGIHRSDLIYCDSAEPDRINEIQAAGYYALKSDKAVEAGIDALKSKPLFICKSAVNLIKEIKNYKWKLDKSGKPTPDEPVKFNDHLMDAMRYAYFTHTKNRVADWLPR